MENKPLEKYKAKLADLELPKEKTPFTKINCPSCQTEVPAQNLDLEGKVAKCGSCNAVFSIQNDLDGLAQLSPAKKEVVRPAGIDIYHFHDDLDITVQQPLHALDILGAIFLPFLGIIGLIASFVKGELFWMGIISWILSAYPFYQLATRDKHKIQIGVNQHFINIKWRPRKFHHDLSIPLQDVTQLYVKQHGSATNYNTLFVILDTAEGQKHLKILPEIPSLTMARYLEQEIERHLGIEDQEVPEETK